MRAGPLSVLTRYSQAHRPPTPQVSDHTARQHQHTHNLTVRCHPPPRNAPPTSALDNACAQRDLRGVSRMQMLKGQKAIVTGSGGLMGGPIAVRLAQAGADVLLN